MLKAEIQNAENEDQPIGKWMDRIETLIKEYPKMLDSTTFSGILQKIKKELNHQLTEYREEIIKQLTTDLSSILISWQIDFRPENSSLQTPAATTTAGEEIRRTATPASSYTGVTGSLQGSETAAAASSDQTTSQHSYEEHKQSRQGKKQKSRATSTGTTVESERTDINNAEIRRTL